MKRRKSQTGLTLLELLIAISLISAITIAGYGPLIDLGEALSDQAARRETILYFQSNRAHAALLNTHIVTCSMKGNECDGVSPNMVTFTDHNNNKVLDTNEEITSQISIDAASLSWRKNGKALVFKPSGHARGNNGTLRICQSESRGFNMIIAPTGRIRSEKNENCG